MRSDRFDSSIIFLKWKFMNKRLTLIRKFNNFIDDNKLYKMFCPKNQFSRDIRI